MLCASTASGLVVEWVLAEAGGLVAANFISQDELKLVDVCAVQLEQRATIMAGV